MKLTKKEEELYECFAELTILHKDLSSFINSNLTIMVKLKEFDMTKLIEYWWMVDRTIKRAKIPKKFLILNALEDKK